ncbi:MAG: GNAT family N-acetyltransferase [Proteobacteria bacterium]|nr:GNAT family N-acetyltransferase [Pseudomonadota bacterium]
MLEILQSVRKLRKTSNVSSFDCGDKDLNDFVSNESWLYQKARLSTTYILESSTGNIDGYFSLANDRISMSDFENKTDFNRFRKKRFPNSKRMKSYPAIKICRLGVSTKMKGQRLGSGILNLIKTMYFTDTKAGCRFITVDAYRDAIPFYEKNGFIPLNTDDADDVTRVLYFDLMDLED